MSQYFLNIINKMNLSDYSKIYDYMGLVNEDDEFVVKLNESSLENTGVIYHMLKSDNFNVCCKGEKDNEGLCITAFKSTGN